MTCFAFRYCLGPWLAVSSLIGSWARADGAGAPAGTIAYVRDGAQIRLIKPDGGGGRELWTQPPSNSETGNLRELAFRPDGKELAFSSSHEMARSFFESDIYSIGLDGKGLHRLTNPPSLDELAKYPKCKVEVTVTNNSTDHLAMAFVAYVVGASKPETLLVSQQKTDTVTFEDVAVLPDSLQPVMAAFGGRRWPGPPLRLVAGKTNKAEMVLTGKGFEMMGAYRPVWSPDGKRLAYRFTQGAGIWCVPAEGKPGAGIGRQLGGKAASPVIAFDLGPANIRGGNLLYAHGVSPDGEPDNSIYQSDEEGKQTVRLLGYKEPLKNIQQVRWLPDGSGFIVLRGEPESFGDAANLARFDLTSKRETRLTHFMRQAVRDFAISPEGRWIVYERGQRYYSPWDKARPELWLIGIDGKNEHLLVKNAGLPAWGK